MPVWYYTCQILYLSYYTCQILYLSDIIPVRYYTGQILYLSDIIHFRYYTCHSIPVRYYTCHIIHVRYYTCHIIPVRYYTCQILYLSDIIPVRACTNETTLVINVYSKLQIWQQRHQLIFLIISYELNEGEQFRILWASHWLFKAITRVSFLVRQGVWGPHRSPSDPGQSPGRGLWRHHK